MKKLAKKHGMVLVFPIYEREMTGFFFNTAAVIDADGKYLGKYRKHHLPQVAPGFWEKFYFTPGNTGYVVFDTKFARVGVYICYDRHFPEGARILGLNGAEIVFNPSATVAGLSEYLWELEQPAHAAANGYFVGAINRVGKEAPWNIGEFYGKSYFCNPRGKIIAQASRDKDELLTHDLTLMNRRCAPPAIYRDRRPSRMAASRTQTPSRRCGNWHFQRVVHGEWTNRMTTTPKMSERDLTKSSASTRNSLAGGPNYYKRSLQLCFDAISLGH
jgi:N-carbamoylputrescine amidase